MSFKEILKILKYKRQNRGKSIEIELKKFQMNNK